MQANATKFTPGQWVWNTRLHGPAIVKECFTNPGEDRESVKIEYVEWSYSGRCWGEAGAVYEGYADTFVPIEQGPCIIREQLADWDDAIAEDAARAVPNPSQGFHRDENAMDDEAQAERNIIETQAEQITQLRAALQTLVKLHHDWDKGRASITVAFKASNDAAIAAARAALAASE